MDNTIYRDLEQERTLLKYLSTVDATRSAYIRPEWFAGEIEGAIFKVLRRSKTVIPPTTLKAEVLKVLPDSQHDLLEIVMDDVYAAEEITTERASEVISSQLRDLFYQRSILDLTAAAQDHAAQGNVTECFKIFRKINLLQTEDQEVESGEYLIDYEARRQSIKDRQIDPKKSGLVPTGIIPLDDRTGGILRGEVGVVVADTGRGKSASKLNMGACAWLQGYNVIFLGLEMEKQENQLRLDSLLTEIPATYFRRANLTKRDYSYWDTIIETFRKRQDNYFEFISAKEVTMVDALALAEGVEARRGQKADLFLLDYIGLIDPGTESQRDHVQRGKDFKRLLNFAGTRKVAVWTSSQSTDEGATRREGMRTIDVKYSRAIAEGAHLIISLYQNDMEVQANMLNCKIIKGRGVEKSGKIVLRPDLGRMVLDIPSWAKVIQGTISNMPKRPKSRSVYKLDSTDDVLKKLENLDNSEEEK